MSGLGPWGMSALVRVAAAADSACFILGFFWLLAWLTGIDPLGIRREQR